MKRLLQSSVIIALLATVTHPSSQGQESKEVKDLMRKKLEHAQKLLEGIALNDFEKIDRAGEGLMVISKAAEWKVLKTPQYEVHGNDFRRAVESLLEKAKEKNLEGAALAYVDLTLSCVKCHKYVRDTRTTRLDNHWEPIP
jgi:hypothetical protein